MHKNNISLLKCRELINHRTEYMRTILNTTRDVSVIERDVSVIEYDPTVPCLIDTVTEFLYSEEFRKHMDKGLELLIEKKKIHGKIGWLANTKTFVAVSEEDIKWIAEDWMVRAAQAGIQYVAMVLPDDEIVKMSNELFDSDFSVPDKNGVIVKQFINLETACDWLRQSLGNI